MFKFLRRETFAETIARRVMRLYRAADGKTARFAASAGLRCPFGCGSCCESGNVESSVLECLPLACELLRSGKAETLLEKLSSSGMSDICIFYEREPHRSGGGHCGVYRWRPLVCRLFGFSCVKDKRGEKTPAACAALKKIFPAESRKMGLAPVMTDISRALAAIDPVLAGERMSVNEAARAALEKVMMTEKIKCIGKNKGRAIR